MQIIDRINQTPELKAFCEAGDFAGAADAMQSDRRTVRAISLTELMHAMNFRGMLTRLIRPTDNGEKWAGTVVNMIAAVEAGGNSELNAAVHQWFSHITNDRNQTFDTTREDYANLFHAIRQAVADGDQMPTSADFDALIALGGGYAFSPTADSIQRAWITEQAVAAKRTERDALMTWVANAQATLADTDELTISELQSLCDAVAASVDGLVGE